MQAVTEILSFLHLLLNQATHTNQTVADGGPQTAFVCWRCQNQQSKKVTCTYFNINYFNLKHISGETYMMD